MILNYLASVLGEGTRHNTKKGVQYSYDCPMCGETRERLFINVDTKLFYCHNCQNSGTIITFISEYTRIPWLDALAIYREHEGYEFILPEDLSNEIYTKLKGNYKIQAPKYVHPLPEEFILIEEARGRAGQAAWDYVKDRGITKSMLERYYIGYCAEGKYANRIIMPDFENGELVYWQGRTWLPPPENEIIRKKTYKKVMNPSLTKEQISEGVISVDKSEVVGNIDSILHERMAVLCEGKFDQYAIGTTGASLYGKHMSDTQFMKLVMNKDKIDVIVIMLDGDAFKNAIYTASRLYQHFDEVLICKLPVDKDPGKLGTRGCLEVLNDAMKYSPMFEVKARIKGWL